MNGAAIATACSFDRGGSAGYQTRARCVSQTVARKRLRGADAKCPKHQGDGRSIYLSKALHKAGHFIKTLNAKLATRFLSALFDHVLQYVRTIFSGDDLRRKPRAGDRLRGRWLPAAHRALRTRYSTVPRSPPPRSITLHHPTSGAGHSQDPLGRIPG